MTQLKDDCADYQRRLWTRTNAHLYIRHDAYRFAPPGSPIYTGRDVVKYFWPDQSSQPSNSENSASRPGVVEWTGKRGRWMPEAADDSTIDQSTLLSRKSRLAAFESDLAKLKSEIAWLRFQRAFARYVQVRLKANFNPAQPRVPAGNSDGGQWTGDGGSADRNDPRVISDAAPDNLWKPSAQYAQNVATGSGPRSKAKATDVLLPNGTKIPDKDSPTGYMQSPLPDLSTVAQAGQRTGLIYRSLLENPQTALGAIGFLGAALYRDVGTGGNFDYQREGGHLTGFVQLRHYRNVSNFNVGLYCQQAGLTLNETLSIAGAYARFFSGNAAPSAPYGLDPQTREFIEKGFRTAQRGVFRSTP